MKVCYVATQLNHPYNYKFLKKFNEHNYKVICVTFTKKIVSIPSEYLELSNITYINILPPCSFYKLLGPFNFLYKIYRLKKLLNKFRPDILHSGYIRIDSWICAITGYKPLLVMGWGTDILIDPFKDLWTYIKTRYSIKKADGLTCDSKYQAEYLCKIGGNLKLNKVIIFPWGIDLNVFQYKPNKSLRKKLGWEDKVVLIRNRNLNSVYGTDLYGHKIFVEAFKIAYEKNNNLRVISIGNGNLKNYVLNELKKISPNCFVHFDYCTPDKMAEYLNAVDIYVNTSTSDGTSCSMLEAMACGLPVITTDIFVNYEWVKDDINGYIIPRFSVEEVTNKILLLAKNHSLRKTINLNNIQITNNRADWNQNFEKLAKCYNELIKNHNL